MRGAFDGEYFHLNVPGHFLNAELVSEDVRDWYSFIWDPAHIIELAEKHTRNAAPSIQKNFDTISSISKSFSHGKSFRQLIDEAATADLNENYDNEYSYQESEKSTKKLRAPGHFSDTRFGTYSSEVIRKWPNNYEYYYRLMNREQKDELDTIDNATFLFTCGPLSDIYEIIGKTSNAVQKPGMTSWEVSSTIETYLSTLEKMMGENLKDTKVSSLDKKIFPTVSSMVTEITSKSSYDNCPIFVRKYVVHSTRRSAQAKDTDCDDFEDALKATAKPLSEFVTNFVSNLRSRREIEKEKNMVLVSAENLFDINQVLNYTTSEDIKEDLQKYAALAKASGNLDSTSNISDLYDMFATSVKNIAPAYRFDP